MRKLAANHVMISFFNDVDVTADDPRVAAAEYFGTKGFFSDYNARLDEPVSDAVLKLWREGFTQLKQGKLNPTEFARRVHGVRNEVAKPGSPKRGDVLNSFEWR